MGLGWGWIRMYGRESLNKESKCALPFPKRLWQKRTVAVQGVKSHIVSKLVFSFPLWTEKKAVLNKEKWKYVAVALVCHV